MTYCKHWTSLFAVLFLVGCGVPVQGSLPAAIINKQHASRSGPQLELFTVEKTPNKALQEFTAASLLGRNDMAEWVVASKNGVSLLIPQDFKNGSNGRVVKVEKPSTLPSTMEFFTLNNGSAWAFNSTSVARIVDSKIQAMADLPSLPGQKETTRSLLSLSEENLILWNGRLIEILSNKGNSIELQELALNNIGLDKKTITDPLAVYLNGQNIWIVTKQGDVHRGILNNTSKATELNWVDSKSLGKNFSASRIVFTTREEAKGTGIMALAVANDILMMTSKNPNASLAASGGKIEDLLAAAAQSGAPVVVPADNSKAAQIATGTGDNIWDSKIQPLMKRHCAGYCHADGQTVSRDKILAAGFKSSTIDRVSKGEMPPGKNNLSDADRAAIVDWLKSAK